METAETTIVGIGEVIIKKEKTILGAIGLGSCVAVYLYDTESEIRGLGHIMLPDSDLAKKNKKVSSQFEKTIYADVAIKKMIEEMNRYGAKTLQAKIVGGAKMFSQLTNPFSMVGDKNINSVKKILSENNIRIIAEETGGNVGRSMLTDFDNKIHIRTINGEVEI